MADLDDLLNLFLYFSHFFLIFLQLFLDLISISRVDSDASQFTSAIIATGRISSAVGICNIGLRLFWPPIWSPNATRTRFIIPYWS